MNPIEQLKNIIQELEQSTNTDLEFLTKPLW